MSTRCARRLERGTTSPPRHSCILPYSKAIAKERDPQSDFLYEPRSFSLRIPLQSKIKAFGPLRTMDDIIFYQPPSASRSQPPRLPGAVTASNAPGGPIVSLSVRRTASQLNQQNGISTGQINKSRGVSDLSQKSHASDQRRKNDIIQEQGTCRD
jgi:hypothetical protein